MAQELHVVSFNVPWPADYGGVIDVYYRLKALHDAGVAVHLHCFTYGRAEAPELEQICASVHYYKRNMSPLLHLGRRPFIVSSRDCKALRERLLQDNLPVLLEGIHCCALLEHADFLRGRTVMVRAHNVETDYYGRLAATERAFFRKIYLALESRKLKRYEHVLVKASAVLPITESDADVFRRMGCRDVRVMAGGHRLDAITSLTGRGDYVIFHGDLSVADNAAAAERLIDKVFSRIEHRLVIAGRNPSQHLLDKAKHCPNVSVVANPDDAAMAQLVAQAQACLLLTSQPTGLKLKLLNSLFEGRYCIVNSYMVAGTDLGQLCCVADSDEALVAAIERIMAVDFTAEEIALRSKVLQPYRNGNVIKPLLSLLQNV